MRVPSSHANSWSDVSQSCRWTMKMRNSVKAHPDGQVGSNFQGFRVRHTATMRHQIGQRLLLSSCEAFHLQEKGFAMKESIGSVSGRRRKYITHLWSLSTTSF